jgi:hypothetical protein
MSFKFFKGVEKKQFDVNWTTIYGSRYCDNQYLKLNTTYRNKTWSEFTLSVFYLFPYTINKIKCGNQILTEGVLEIFDGSKIDEIEISFYVEK